MGRLRAVDIKIAGLPVTRVDELRVEAVRVLARVWEADFPHTEHAERDVRRKVDGQEILSIEWY